MESKTGNTSATKVIASNKSKKPPKLLDQVRSEIRKRHYSLRTEQSYVHWIRRFILLHHKRYPKDMGAAEVVGFLTCLAVSRKP